MLLQVNQTIAFQSGIQAFTCPEGFAPSLAPIVQKYLKASPCIMVHASKHFTGIPVVEVVTPSTKDAVLLRLHGQYESASFDTGCCQRMLLEDQ